MKYFIGEKRYPVKLDYYIGEGEEGEVYRSGKETIKIYWGNRKNNDHPVLSLDDVSAMTKLKSNHILLPRRPVYNSNDEFCGYSTRYIASYYGDEEFLENWYKEICVLENMHLFSLSMKMHRVYSDAYYLSKNGIVLRDTAATPANHIFNGNFWLIDPGCYMYSTETVDKILEKNIFELNYFFFYHGFGMDDVAYQMTEWLESKGSKYTVCDLIKDEGKSLERTSNFVKKLEKLEKYK